MLPKRPQPPPGFVPFRWKHVKDKDFSIPQCPNCGAPKEKGASWGYTYGPSNTFTDPAAQRALDEADAKGVRLVGAGDTNVSCDGVPILMHWSRYCVGHCDQCRCEIWHDFIAPCQYYYRPKPNQNRDIQ